MPSVPYSGVPSVSPSETPTPYISDRGVSADAFGAQVGQAQQGLGRAIEGFGDVLAKHAMEMKSDENRATANELFVEGTIREGELKAQLGALKGKAAMDFYNNEYVPGITKINDDLSGKASNPEVKKIFQQDFRRQMGYAIVNGASHAATQLRQYNSNQADARINLAINDATTAEGKEFISLLDVAKEQVAAKAKNENWSEEETALKTKIATSSVWSAKLTSLAHSDPERALKVFKENEKEFDGETRLKLGDSLNKLFIQGMSRIKGQQIMEGVTGLDEKYIEEIKKSEGFTPVAKWDNKQYSYGHGTKAPGAGATITKEEADVALRQEVARAAKVVDEFSPNLPAGTRAALISLTFNAGPSWTTAGLGQKIKAGDLEGARANFAAYTNASGEPNPGLAARRMRELGWWGGEAGETGPINATSSEARLGKAYNQADAEAARAFPNDPAYRALYQDTLRTSIHNNFNKLKQVAADNELQLKNMVNGELIDTTKRITDLSQLSPQAQQAFRNSNPYDQRVYLQQMRKNATQDIPETPESRAKVTQIRGMMLTNPEEFMKLQPAAMNDLTISQQNQITRWQQDKRAVLERGAKMNSFVRQPDIEAMLNDAQIFRSRTDTNANRNYERFIAGAESVIEREMMEKKRPLTPKENTDIAAKLLRDVVTSPGTFWNTTQPRYELEALKRPVTVETPADLAKLEKGQHYIRPGETVPRIKQ